MTTTENSPVERTIAIAALLALACGGQTLDNPEDYPEEYGQAQQPSVAQCTSPNAYGVDAARESRCAMSDPAAICYFPKPTLSGGFSVRLGSGWTTVDKIALSSGADQAALFIDNQFFPCYAQGPLFGQHFAVRSGAPDSIFDTIGPTLVTLNKGTIPGSVSGGFNFARTVDLMTLACDASFTKIEPYNGKAKGCTHWIGTVDYADLVAWSGANFTTATRNLFQKAFAYGLGLGRDPSFLMEGVTDHYVTRNTTQNVWDSGPGAGEIAWTCNYVAQERLHPGEQTTLSCQ